MLKLIVSGEELFDEATETFSSFDDVVLDLEHSLVSLSKWESIYQKPFLGPDTKTPEEMLGYIKAMIMTPDFLPDVIYRLSNENLQEINDYISSNQSATTFNELLEDKGRGRAEVITSELIYYWLVSFTIPFECETWHLNRLFSLIRICNIKNSKEKKMSRSELNARNRALNAERRTRLGTKG